MQLLTSALTLAVTPLVAGFTSPGSGSGSLTVRPNPTRRVLQRHTWAPASMLSMSAETGAADTGTDALAGYTKLESGLMIMDIKVGSGEEPKDGGTVSVHYTGFTSMNGVPQNEFDDSRKRGYPFKFVMGDGRVIKGWEEGLKGMKVGGTRKLIIPAELAYGDNAAAEGLIPANSEIQFDCELMEVGRGGIGAVELGLDNARMSIQRSFENKFFAAFFAIWLVTFIAPRGFFEDKLGFHF